ncbi:MAG TPA: zf-HC2 domain-containing protein [Nitrospirae bacterium]|nr:hypothetical protein BMS3Abin06_01064 [bacterium BMS3Abin06]HDH11845.1 zf-HC2 domain-containing protein [Nitrospirota bacterium]HDZ02813.1 zf-HC2 domain-containing protein [Nitrospirota bacterium]
MTYTHDRIKEMLPDYVNGLVSEKAGKDIETHLKECSGCAGEVSFISELIKVEVPDPGELYWKTLPQKMRAISTQRDEKRFSFSSLLRPAPVFATTLLIAIVIISSVYIINTKSNGIDFLFEDPLAFQAIDINGISEEDLSAAIGETIKENTTEIFYTEDFSPHSYFMEFASLNSWELEGIYEVLKGEQQTGG